MENAKALSLIKHTLRTGDCTVLDLPTQMDQNA